MIQVFEKTGPDFQRKLDALCNRSSELSTDIEAAARKTIAKVRAGGDAALRASFAVAAGAGPHATYACVDSWLTDFRGDLPKIDVPTLVVHGTADRILPFEATAKRLRDERLIADLEVVEVPDGPHNIAWTHPDEVNAALLGFLAR